MLTSDRMGGLETAACSPSDLTELLMRSDSETLYESQIPEMFKETIQRMIDQGYVEVQESPWYLAWKGHYITLTEEGRSQIEGLNRKIALRAYFGAPASTPSHERV